MQDENAIEAQQSPGFKATTPVKNKPEVYSNLATTQSLDALMCLMPSPSTLGVLLNLLSAVILPSSLERR